MRKKELANRFIELQRQVYHTMEEKEPSPWLTLSLTNAQLRVAFLLALNGEMKPTAVANALGVPKANITGIVDRLVAQGIVSREDDPQDRRSYILRLTEEGQSLIDQLREMATARYEKALSKMSPDSS